MNKTHFHLSLLPLAIVLLAILIGSRAPIAHAAPPSPTTIPVVFIPGIGGTRLADINNSEYWTAAGFSGHEGLSLYPKPQHPQLYPTNAITEATFLGIHVPFEDWQTYGPLFEYFQSQGFVQYNTYQNWAYQTSFGCDLTQAPNHPNLFVFAYDWRQSNAYNATLLQDYIACVQKFYPNTKVNLVAHSMGGLVARRYILDYPTTNSVNALISVASPYLGAPKLVWVEETGNFIFFVWASTLLDMIGSFNGASELMPTQAYYNLGGAPALIEDGQDLLNNGNYYQQFDYPTLVSYMNTAKGKQGFLPGTANQQFHTFNNGTGNQQDNWSNDTTGIQYFHIVGAGTQPDTISQVVATTFLGCISNYTICNLATWMYPNFDIGDATVPLLASSRIGPNGNYNAPNATVYTCQGQGANNQNVDHTGMLSNPLVQGLLTQYLAQANGAIPQPPPPSSTCGAGTASAPIANAAQAATYHRLTLSGVKDVKISDNSNDPITNGAQIYALNSNSYVLLLASGKPYNITFTSTNNSLYAEWLLLNKTNPKQAVRFLDQEVKPNLHMRIHVADGQIASLRFDADKNGSFEGKINPTIKVSGVQARDLTPPEISLGFSPAQAGHLVKFTAKDTNGVARIVYTLDGTHFQKYNGAFLVNSTVKTVYAFADDGVGNRSKLIKFDIK